MIILKLTHYSYSELCILQSALERALVSLQCENYSCELCAKVTPCNDIAAALALLNNKIDMLELSEPDPPSDCF